MKTITKFCIVILFAFGIKANAQITLQKTYAGEGNLNFQWVYLEHSGFKYAYLHSDSLTFYNLNYSLFRDAVFPVSISNSTFDIQFISEGLFDTDTLHIDYLIAYSGAVSNYAIYKDDGTLVFSEDTAALAFGFTGMGMPISTPIFNSDSGTFMIVIKGIFPQNEEVYKLPGNLPCIPGCSGNSGIVTEMPQISNSAKGALSVYPNPSNNYSNVYYSLPPGINEGEIIVYDLAGREIKEFTVTRQFDHLQLSTSDIRAGTYFYQLMVNGNNISTKKIVVVK